MLDVRRLTLDRIPQSRYARQRLGCRLGRCCCVATGATGHPHPLGKGAFGCGKGALKGGKGGFGYFKRLKYIYIPAVQPIIFGAL